MLNRATGLWLRWAGLVLEMACVATVILVREPRAATMLRPWLIGGLAVGAAIWATGTSIIIFGTRRPPRGPARARRS
jgi:hypothetical protein